MDMQPVQLRMQDFVNGKPSVPFPRSPIRVGDPAVSPRKIFQTSCVAIDVEKLPRRAAAAVGKIATRRLISRIILATHSLTVVCKITKQTVIKDMSFFHEMAGRCHKISSYPLTTTSRPIEHCHRMKNSLMQTHRLCRTMCSVTQGCRGRFLPRDAL